MDRPNSRLREPGRARGQRHREDSRGPEKTGRGGRRGTNEKDRRGVRRRPRERRSFSQPTLTKHLPSRERGRQAPGGVCVGGCAQDAPSPGTLAGTAVPEVRGQTPVSHSPAPCSEPVFHPPAPPPAAGQLASRNSNAQCQGCVWEGAHFSCSPPPHTHTHTDACTHVHTQDREGEKKGRQNERRSRSKEESHFLPLSLSFPLCKNQEQTASIPWGSREGRPDDSGGV